MPVSVAASVSTSRTAKTRSAAERACWIVLLDDAMRLMGLYIRNIAVRKEKNVPGVIVPRMTCEPPYQMIPATPMTPIASNTGEVMAEACVDFIKERTYASLYRAKRRSSADSFVKPF